jgi:TRAP-type C4-dicarboxylate transport system substrate-binding protein
MLVVIIRRKNMLNLKKYLSRSLATLAVFAAAFLFSTSAVVEPAGAKDLKMAFFPSPKHPLWSKMMVPWAKDFEKANPNTKVKGFPGSQIGGSPPGAYKRVVNGISDIELHLPGYTSTVFPRTLVMEIPLQWSTPSEATQAFWRIYNKHIASEYKRVKLLAAFATDVPAVMTNKVVKTPSDLKGMKIRTPSRNQAAIIKGLGAIPVAMPMTQTYSAIQKGVVDGAIVGISVIRSFKIAEVADKYIVDLPFGYSPIIIAMNRKSYDGLSKAERSYIDANSGLKYSLVGAKNYEKARVGSLKLINDRKNTSVVSVSASERKKWVEKLEVVVSDWVATFEKEGIPYRELLADYLKK